MPKPAYDASTGTYQDNSEAFPLDTAPRAADWSQSSQTDNAANAQVKAAVAGKSHYITEISGDFSVAVTPGKAFTLLDGATTVRRYFVFAEKRIVFNPPLKITQGNSATVSLPASGTAGNLGAVNISGYTR